MTFDDFCNVVSEAESVERRARDFVQKTAYMCRGRLRLSGVDGRTLSALKRELRDWDSVRSCWK